MQPQALFNRLQNAFIIIRKKVIQQQSVKNKNGSPCISGVIGKITRQDESDSAIDLALVSPSIVASSNWYVMSSLGSDHLPCGVNVRRQVQRQTKKAQMTQYPN